VDATTARYVKLIEALGHELGHVRGWKKLAADRLGIRGDHLSKILAGEKPVGLELTTRATERLGLPAGYWSEPFAEAERGVARGIGMVRARLRAPTEALTSAAARWFDPLAVRDIPIEEIQRVARAVASLASFDRATHVLHLKPRTERERQELRWQGEAMVMALLRELNPEIVEDILKGRST
jgi:hypothetical protein